MSFIAYFLLTLSFSHPSFENLVGQRLPHGPPLIFTFYGDVLSKYSHFDLILHVDNKSQHVINDFFSIYKALVTIFNHDTWHSTVVRRLTSASCVNVVYFDNPLRFSSFIQHDKNVNFGDIVIFLTGSTSLGTLGANYHAMPNLSKCGRVLVINYCSGVEVYTIEFYKGTESGVLLLLEKIEHGKNTQLSDEFMPKKFDNFNGHLLRVVYIDYYPYVYCVEKIVVNGTTVCTNAIGSEYELLKSLSDSLNFTYLLIEASNSSYDSLFGGLISEQYDFGIGGLSVTTHRLEIFQFSSVIKFEDVAFMFHNTHPLLQGTSFFKMISTELQALILLTQVIITLFLYWVIKSNSTLTISFVKIFEAFFRVCFEQPVKLKTLLSENRPFSVYIVWISWCVFFAVVNVTIRSKLTSILIHKPKVDITLTKLLTDGRNLVADHALSKTYLDLFLDEEKSLIVKYYHRLCRLCFVLPFQISACPSQKHLRRSPVRQRQWRNRRWRIVKTHVPHVASLCQFGHKPRHV